MLSGLYNVFNFLATPHFLSNNRKVKKNNDNKPEWWNRECQNAVAYFRDELKAYNMFRCDFSKKVMKKARNYFRREIRMAKAKFRRNKATALVDSAKCDSKKFWRIINNKITPTNGEPSPAVFFDHYKFIV